MSNEKIKSIPYRLDQQDHTKLKLFCVSKGISMQEFMERAIQEYMKKWAV